MNKNLPTTQGNILVTDLKTGAITAIATDNLAAKDAKVLDVIGTGNLAFEQVLGVLEVRDIEQIYLFNRTESKAVAFKQRLEDFGITASVEDLSDVDVLVEKSDVVNCATQSKTPVYDGSNVTPGTHINGVGSFTPEMKEMDTTIIERADQIYVDDTHGIKEEAGELIDSVDKNIISWDDIN